MSECFGSIINYQYLQKKTHTEKKETTVNFLHPTIMAIIFEVFLVSSIFAWFPYYLPSILSRIIAPFTFEVMFSKAVIFNKNANQANKYASNSNKDYCKQKYKKPVKIQIWQFAKDKRYEKTLFLIYCENTNSPIPLTLESIIF